MSVISCLSSGTVKSFKTEMPEILKGQKNLKAERTLAAIILICVIIYVLWSFVSHAWIWRSKKKVRVFKRSMSLGALHGGDLAVQRLVEYHNARAKRASVDASETELEAELEKEHPGFKKLQVRIFLEDTE
jgi:hypothetical protein